MSNSTEEVQALIDALSGAGYSTKRYSGRGMYGKSCVSVRSDDGEDGDEVSAWNVAKALFSEEHDGKFDRLPEPRQDQLGLGQVLYWPSYEWPKEEAWLKTLYEKPEVTS